MLRYTQIRKYDSANGSGIGTTVFFSGCTHFCPGCFNSEYWDQEVGEEFGPEIWEKVVENLKDEHVSHLSLLGGEPLLFHDPETMENFLAKVKEEVPEKPIWIWTGYTLSELESSIDSLDRRRLDLLRKYADYVIDGKFLRSEHSPRLLFRGSKNQTIWRKSGSGFVRDRDLNSFRL